MSPKIEATRTERVCIEPIVKKIGKERLLSGKIHLSIEGHEVDFTTTKTAFNGKRLWFLCPVCKRRARCLYLYRQQLGCIACLSITYLCKTMHRNSFYENVLRPVIKLLKIERKLKRKWLRKEKKEKLVKKYEELESKISLFSISQITDLPI